MGGCRAGTLDRRRRDDSLAAVGRGALGIPGARHAAWGGHRGGGGGGGSPRRLVASCCRALVVRPDWAASLLTSLAAAGLVVGLWLPGTRLLPIATIVSVLVVEEVGVGLWWSRRHATPGQDPSAGGTDVLRRPSAAASLGPSTARQDAVATDDLLRRDKACLAHGSPPREIVQQLTRVRTPEDTEELRGWLRVPLASGQRTESVHLAFCPPLAATPELLVEQIDGPEARLKTGQLLPDGARIDLKLVSAADEPASVVLEFVAGAEKRCVVGNHRRAGTLVIRHFVVGDYASAAVRSAEDLPAAGRPFRLAAAPAAWCRAPTSSPAA